MAQNWTPPSSPSAAPANIPNYMILAVLSVFCCLPAAILALMNAAKVNKLVAAGDSAGAMEASASAKKYAVISIGLGVVVTVICLLAVGAFYIFSGGAR